MIISDVELAQNLDEYLEMLDKEDVIIIHDGQVTARLTKVNALPTDALVSSDRQD